MATEVLRPQDCLIQRIRVSPASYPRRKACNYGNSYSNPSSRSSARPNRRQQMQQIQQQQPQPAKPEQQRKRYVPAQSEPSTSSRSSSDDLSKQARSAGLVMEKPVVAAASGDMVVCDGTQRLGPDPEMVPKQVRIVDLRSPAPAPAAGRRRCDMYAGSAFAVSPEPSSLPLPSFSKKKHVSFDDSATRDLRRLLRLD
ncbi:uncharacterized protein LOC104425304 [Eucalyptus grandis]|uniref:uncharacterized protein LOC104425304 n=1 Tax=Eucalyptus grandis TaxID=71139 RepID=UPI00192E7A0A|nr:uncharacterized protein LOC104425304 [Eucalyptus grandis]